MNRTTLINSLIKERGYYQYLEVGTQHRKNFDAIIAKSKIGIEPEFVDGDTKIANCTSDEFFTHNVLNVTFDLIFIDGLHEAAQVERDIVNAMAVLNAGGVLLIHDCRPPDEFSQRVPREAKQWWGTTWRAAYGFMQKYQGWQMWEFDCGILQIEKQEIEPGFTDYETPFEVYRATYP